MKTGEAHDGAAPIATPAQQQQQRSPGGGGASDVSRDSPGSALSTRSRGRGGAGRPELLADLLDGVAGSDALEGTVPPLPENVHEDILRGLGPGLTACAYDGNWHVRESAVLKVVLELRDGEDGRLLPKSARNPRALVLAVIKLAEHAFTDVNAKVFVAGVELLTGLLRLAGSDFAVEKHDPRHHLHRVCATLTAKLREANKRCIAPARSALIAIATRVVPVGASLVSGAVLRPPGGRTALRWQELERRLSLAAELIPQLPPESADAPFGAGGCVKFVHATGGLRHSRSEVRTASRAALANLAAHGAGGTLAVMRLLKAAYSGARKADTPDFDAIERALRREVGDGRGAPSSEGGERERERERERGGGRGGRRRGGGGAARSGGGGDRWRCQFCREPCGDKDTLDLHFVTQCRMLVSCPRCAQVVPVPDLTEHLLMECDLRDDHGRCPRCNEAVHKKFFRGHVERGACLPAREPSEANRCPFCHEDIAPFAEGWEAHLIGEECPKNPRSAAAAAAAAERR